MFHVCPITLNVSNLIDLPLLICIYIYIIYLYMDLSIYLSIYLSIHLSTYLSIYLSICLSIYIYVYIYYIQLRRLIQRCIIIYHVCSISQFPLLMCFPFVPRKLSFPLLIYGHCLPFNMSHDISHLCCLPIKNPTIQHGLFGFELNNDC